MIKYDLIIRDEYNKWILQGKSNKDSSKIKYKLNFMGLIKEWEGNHVILPNDFYETLNKLK